MIKKGIAFLIILLSVFTACKRNNQPDVDISEIDLDLNIKRLDKEIFEIDPANVADELPGMINEYGDFFELYSYRIIRLGNPYQDVYADELTGFITDYTMNKVYEEVMSVFPDLNEEESNIEAAFKRYKYHFPDRIIPSVYTYIGGFNQSIVVSDSILGIGTDKYLGRDCEFYDRLGIANYLQNNMNPGNIPVDALKSWALTEFVYKDSVDNLVNNMVYQGKIQYFLDVIFPNTPDSLKIGFTGNQLRWCIGNEKQIWNYLIENKLLFSTDYMTINQHINPAPFTIGYPSDSPGRASVWLGWQIVNTYMEKNSKVSLKELMLDNDYQKILSESRYEP